MPTVWLATADGLMLLDLLAIELAVNGLRTGDWKLTGPETAFAADTLLQRGTDRALISRRLGIDYRTLRIWFPADDTPLCEALSRVRTQAEWRQEKAQRQSAAPPAQCGTYQGARRHSRRKEPLCPPCREAKNAGDRHYREHGTYKGAPTVSAAAS
ncbi:hypothetical protein K4B79_18915 [Streptomyces lincolnensis]|uniref:hypothetical protein n=1 Tax=Streptomyces lincolnensis TaxID=1915 RepID=UPI001E45ECFA|nr:hypothetical protein [Streptomyces lincolnensis]MCD7440288.1 hypothetical protein [Streptomyces lincolnensis]